MNTTKAIYWIALGAFTLGLSSEYQNGSFPVLHRVADRAESALCRAASHAEQTLAMARMLTNRRRPDSRMPDFRVPDVQLNAQFLARQQAQVERVVAEHQADIERAASLRQADLERVQQRLERVQAVMERAQFKRVRVLERSRLKLSSAADRHRIVICPKTGEAVSVNVDADGSDLDMELPDVE